MNKGVCVLAAFNIGDEILNRVGRIIRQQLDFDVTERRLYQYRISLGHNR